MIIRKARINDLEELTKLYLEYDYSLLKITPKNLQIFKKRKKDYKLRIKKNVEKMLKDKNLILVCEIDNKLVGSVRGRIIKIENDLFLDKPKLGYLEYLIVAKEHRGKGISTQLKNELFKYFKRNKVDTIRLEVIKTNPAIKSYEKWGFKLDTVKMMKELKD